MSAISKLSPTKETTGVGSTKKNRKGAAAGLPFGLIVVILSFCCLLSLAVSILHGTVLHGLPEISATAAAGGGGGGYPAAAALKSSLLEKSSAAGGTAGGDVATDVDRLPAGAVNGEGRPVLASDLRLGQLSCQKHGGPDDEHAQEMVYWVCFFAFSLPYFSYFRVLMFPVFISL
jgi:hypothetical protein